MERLSQIWIVSSLSALVLTLGTVFIAQSLADYQLEKQTKDKTIVVADRPSLEIIP